MATFGRSRILPPALSCALALLVLAGPSPATAQRISRDAFSVVAHPTASLPAPPQAGPAPSAGRVILGGSLGSAVGLVAGSGVGYGLGRALASCGEGSDDCGEGWDMLGALAGSVVGSALGAKLATTTEGRGPTFGTALKGALLGTVPGLAAAVALGTIDRWAGVVGFSVAQGAVAGLYARSRAPR